MSSLTAFSPTEILVYLRKSRSDDPLLTVEEVLQKHETILDEWAQKHIGAVVPEINKYREVVSGETIDDRPEIKKLLKLIESPKIKAVLIVEIQRLSRGDLEDAGRLIKLLRYTNTLVITPAKTYDLNDDYDRDFFERELKRGNEFLEYQKKIMGRGRLLSVQQGNYIGNTPPYGYEKDIVMDGKKKCHTLKINESEADIVRTVFEMYVYENKGYASIAHQLDSLGVKPPRGGHWSPSALRDMLANIHYTGKVKWNWRKTVTVVDNGDIIATRPKSKAGEFLVYEGKHPAIISDELFNAAQQKQGRNHRTKAAAKVANPLAGLVYCHCGRAMALRTYKKDGSERCAPRLICCNQSICKTSSCLFDEMVERVCTALAKSIADFDVQIKNNDKKKLQLRENLIKRLESQLEDLNRKEISQWEKYSEESMPREIFEKLNEKVIREKAETRQALETAKLTAPAVVDYEEKIYRFRSALNALQSTTLPAEQKNKLLKTCIERIYYNRPKSERIKRSAANPTEKLPSGGQWTSPPIELDIRLRL